MAMNFPDAPSVDDEFTVGDQTWKWTGTVWETVTITSYTPSAHATSHELGGSDELALDPTQVTGLEALNTGTAGYTALSNGASGLSYQPVSHNYIINGAFDVWQRGTSFTSGTNVYTADRWQYQASGATSTITQETFTPAELVANGFGDAKYYLSLEATVANDNAGIRHKIEDVRTLAGQTATLSFWAKSDATSLKAVIGQSFGSGGSSFNTVSTQTFTPTTSWVRYSFQYNVTSVSGKTIGDGSALEVEIANGNSELFTLDIWGVQLEAGSVATPFKRNAPSLQGELAACQRYYYRLDPEANNRMVNMGYSTSSSNTRTTIFFPVTMRAEPTFSPSSTTSEFAVYGAASVTSFTDIRSGSAGGRYSSEVLFDHASVMTARQTAQIKSPTSGTVGYLEWSAEL